jgi:hypothetical protein
MVICYNFIYIWLWPARIRFGLCLKKVLFYIYPNRELIQIVTVMQVPASQFVVARRPCSLLNGNDNGYSVTNGFVKRKWSCPGWRVVLYLIQTRFYLIATQLMVINAVEFWLCDAQQSKSMAKMVNTVMHFSFWLYRNSLSILVFDWNNRNLMHIVTAVSNRCWPW